MDANLYSVTAAPSIELLTAEVERILSQFQATWSYDGRDFARPNSEQTLRKLIDESPIHIQARLRDEFFAEGPLNALFAIPQLQEIIINGANEIWVESAGKFWRHNDQFLSETTFKNFIDRLCAEAAVKIDLSVPFTDGRWRDFRLHMGCAPLTHCLYHLNLRRLPSSPWTLPLLEEAAWAQTNRITTLRELVRARKNILFIAPQGAVRQPFSALA